VLACSRSRWQVLARLYFVTGDAPPNPNSPSIKSVERG